MLFCYTVLPIYYISSIYLVANLAEKYILQNGILDKRNIESRIAVVVAVVIIIIIVVQTLGLIILTIIPSNPPSPHHPQSHLKLILVEIFNLH